MNRAQTRSFNPLLVRTSYFRPTPGAPLVALRAWFFSRLLRIALRLGFVVVLVGPARCGKSYLLERITPGNIIDGAAMYQTADFKPVHISTSELPDAAFSIDEAAVFEPAALRNTIAALKDKAFAISIQSLNDTPFLAAITASRRVLLVEFQPSR